MTCAIMVVVTVLQNNVLVTIDERKEGKKIKKLIPQEDFESVKVAMRMNGNIPNKKLVVEFYEKGMNELDHITLGRVDELCHEDVLRLEDEKREENRKRSHFFNTINDELRPYIRRYIR